MLLLSETLADLFRSSEFVLLLFNKDDSIAYLVVEPFAQIIELSQLVWDSYCLCQIRLISRKRSYSSQSFRGSSWRLWSFFEAICCLKLSICSNRFRCSGVFAFKFSYYAVICFILCSYLLVGDTLVGLLFLTDSVLRCFTSIFSPVSLCY